MDSKESQSYFHKILLQLDWRVLRTRDRQIEGKQKLPKEDSIQRDRRARSDKEWSMCPDLF